MNEEWRDVKGFKGLYQVSSLGRLKRLAGVVYNMFGKQERDERILKTTQPSQKYASAQMSRTGDKTKKVYMHRLVAETFMGWKDTGAKSIIVHINGNTLDNRVENLKITTPSEHMTKYWSAKPKRTELKALSVLAPYLQEHEVKLIQQRILTSKA